MCAKINIVLRWALGLILIVFGLNKFIGFLPMPELPEGATDFMLALVRSGYMMPMVALVEIVSGILLLRAASTPFALILLAPISVNIVLFHLFLDMNGIVLAAVVAVLNVILIIKNFDAYRSIFKCSSKCSL